jgi:hypothetical protein
MLDGHSAHEAIALIRAERAPAALNNGAFVRWLVTEAQAQLATGADGPVLAA